MNEESFCIDSTTWSEPEPTAEESEEIITKLRSWVESSSSKYNEELLNWLKLPFKPPNKDMDIRFLQMLEKIPDEDGGVSEKFVDEYIFMLEMISKGVYHLPSNFDEFDMTSDIDELRAKRNLELLLVHVVITQLKGGSHSYLAAIDFPKTTITFIETGEGLLALTVDDNYKMEKVKYVANQIKPAEYTINIVTDAPPCDEGKFECVFHTCLFAKCLVRKEDYHELKDPNRKEILYELLKAELI